MEIAIAIGVVGLVVIVLGQWAWEKNDREDRELRVKWEAEAEALR